ncbi:nischarin-like isoform X2 [Montipora foliosa]
MAAPTCDSHVPHGEIGNLYDFLYQLKHLKVCGVRKLVELTDNITLKCNLSIFKSLKTLEIDSCEVEPFEGLSVLQPNVTKLSVHNSVHLLKDILVDDEIWEQGVLESVDIDAGTASLKPTSNLRSWTALTEVDFSNNSLPYIDESVALLPEVTRLNLSHNCIEAIEHLEPLYNLVELDLSYNDISTLGGNLNTKLGNVKKLNLAGNQLDSVEGLQKMYSLTTLNLRDNDFTDVGAVLTLGELPCLECLDLRENEMTKEPIYRLRVFTAFDDRAEQLELDGSRPTSREMNRIRELLEEEQNFEIIGYPTPPQYSTLRKGQKKGVDRVIALDSETELQSRSSLEDSNSVVDDTDVAFRSRVEKIRQIGGDSWLRILDEIQGDEELTQLKENTQDCEDDTSFQTEPANNQPSPKLDMLIGEGASPSCESKEQESTGPLTEDEAHPSRLQFGFAPELERIVRDKVESSTDLTSGTYMVEVETEERCSEGTEERMVGVDLSKRIILEIQISTGETFAKHNLDDVSSVDILKLNDVFCVDIRDTFNKEWRRHSVSATSGTGGDYRQVARYRMRSIEDAAELFALLYKFITERSTKDSVPNTLVQEFLADVFSGNAMEWPNPLGIQNALLRRFFENFLYTHDPKPAEKIQGFLDEGHCTRRNQIIYQALRAQFIDARCLRHDRSGPSPEMARLLLWSGCLPYVCPDRELPICLLMTNINIYLFHSSHLDSPNLTRSLTEASELRQILRCFYSFPVRELNEVVFGLYDQAFRMEVKFDGPRGTFSVLTRDAIKTDKFFGTLRDVLGEPLNDDEQLQAPRFRRQFSSGSLPKLIFPDEETINRLKSELVKSGSVSHPDDQHLLIYAIVREIPECSSMSVQENGDLTNLLRSLIVTKSQIFLFDEDHVHWPLPSFARAPPSTPQWVVTKSQRISKIIGLDMFELTGQVFEFFGVYGLSLIFEQEESDTPAEQNCWNLIFRASEERTQLQRSLSQVWKDRFQADLKITYSKPKSHPVVSDVNDSKSFLESSSSTGVQKSPMGTPVELTKTHRRVGSDNLPFLKHSVLYGLESLVALERETLDKFFRKCISQKNQEEEETLLHVLWTGCTPYLFPFQEFQVCVLLSNLYVYILADKEHKNSINKRKGVKLRFSRSPDDLKPTYCFNFIPLCNLRQVCVGLFDQTVRLETELKEETFTFITRDFHRTNTFLECLNGILSKQTGTTHPRAETLTSSIYDSQSIIDSDPSTFTKTDYQLTNSGVKFIYPNDDSLEILKDAIADFSRRSVDCEQLLDVVILVYLLVFHETEPKTEEPRTLVIMDKSLCLCIEDHVNYPLPLFATGLPENPQYNVQDLRDIKSLSRVEFSDFNSCDFKMVFSPTQHQDEDVPDGFDSASLGDLCVITHHMENSEKPDIWWRIVAQTYKEKEKALGLICKLWADIHGGALPVMKAKS